MSRLTHAEHGPYAPPAPARELTAVSADGARLHVEVHGPADNPAAPTVVLAHGWTCSTAFWAAQVRDLAVDHRVIAYDQRGHGRSPASRACTTDALADDLEAVLAATLAPGEKAVLVGHSMGGMTLMAASARPRFREHAVAALLCSTGSSRLVAEARVVPMPAGRLRTRVTKRILGSAAPLGPVTPVARWILKYATMGAGSSPGMVEACARIVHACPRTVRHAWSKVLDVLDLDHGVRELAVPTAVLVGTADRLTPVVHARALVATLPNCVGITELAGLGHMTPVEAPELVTSRIRELVSTYAEIKEGSA
ncbi:alpha/beta hydrolase [Streptomyces sp. NBC_01340]|uniref:alpha/beta fold hydrolase n=1 Tax=unclassified Streptomyces TaxID=2593676 RepID=UPI0022504295|nr:MULTISPECIES: alpha/beta hydrolase [unclassified Streptomyces]MCX4454697.1 alpha/beta hydrolase [Streptomyces sp. NBC_01719]MCX4494057.1 alpha/beta hydrolase [Streptomyces sp. NBC_01728]MCX4591397.1 alpha/beta hydrolase [Streptomyces sp. NBC_01549]WSI39130.1 alpha/beta hydrolase [Streptomyces sp. NBC_01340]